MNIESNSECRLASEESNILSVTDRELVIEYRGVKYHYVRISPAPGSKPISNDISGTQMSVKKALNFSHHGAAYFRYNQPIYSNDQRPPVCSFAVEAGSHSYMYISSGQTIRALRMERAGTTATIHFEMSGEGASSKRFSVTCTEDGRNADLTTFRTHLGEYIDF